MKTNFPRWVVIVAALVSVTGDLSAQNKSVRRRGPTSKIYLAETKGDTQIVNNDRIYDARQAAAFDAPGSVIETKADSHNVFVYSNGTGLYMEENTRISIDRFDQEPFQAGRREIANEPVEPSMSQSQVLLVRGAVGICTSQMVAGSTMNYATSHGMINIRHGRLAIDTTDEQTTIDLLNGDATVRGGDQDLGGQILRPGDRAVIRQGKAGQPRSVVVSQTPPMALQGLENRVTLACNAKKTVSFDVIEKKSEQGLDAPAEGAAQESSAATDQEIVARPTVPEKLPTNITVSADRLPGGTE